jgi:predicted nucleic acid-binding protein
MSAVIADTFYFLGILNRADEAHQRCKEFASEFKGRLFTTDYVVVEVADGLASPNYRARTARFLQQIRIASSVTVVPASESLLLRCLELFASRTDKQWSLTDCISFVVMEDHGLTQAATGDLHFEQAGFRALLV